MFNSYSVKGKKFVVPLILRKDEINEIVSFPMASLFSLNSFERCNARYYYNMVFTPRELFTYVVIITLIICLNAKSNHPSDGLHFIYL